VFFEKRKLLHFWGKSGWGWGGGGGVGWGCEEGSLREKGDLSVWKENSPRKGCQSGEKVCKEEIGRVSGVEGGRLGGDFTGSRGGGGFGGGLGEKFLECAVVSWWRRGSGRSSELGRQLLSESCGHRRGGI